MAELRVKVSAENAAELAARARERHLTRAEYVRQQLFARDRPMDEQELHGLVAAKAREGNMRALEILARAAPVPARPAPDVGVGDDDPFAEIDELAGRRRNRDVG